MKQIQEYKDFCGEYGLRTLEERLYVGRVRDSELKTEDKKFLDKIISEGTITLKINSDAQMIHLKETLEEGRSYFRNTTVNDLQDFINKNYGTGELYIRVHPNGGLHIKEVLSYDKEKAICVDPSTKEGELTNRVTVHYSKRGVHIVPAGRKEESDE